ncbi:MAG: bisanhydrobacterioruberin hydratase [Halolamina sp.]
MTTTLPSLPASRGEAETLLDRVVRENRFTISVFFPLNGAVLLTASAMGWLPAWLSFNPALVLFGTVVMRSPLLVGVTPLLNRRATAGVLGLAAYAYAVEYVGIQTGMPYGEFSYGVALGPTLSGVPVGLPVFFLPLVMNAYLLGLLLLGERARSAPVRLGSVIGLVLVMDGVLDPGAVSLGFWSYAAGGPYYGVPLSNYAGWVLSATVAVVTMDRVFATAPLLARLRECEFMLDDMVSFVILWGGINLWFGNAVPVALAALVAVGLLRADRFDASLLRLGE